MFDSVKTQITGLDHQLPVDREDFFPCHKFTSIHDLDSSLNEKLPYFPKQNFNFKKENIFSTFDSCSYSDVLEKKYVSLSGVILRKKI